MKVWLRVRSGGVGWLEVLVLWGLGFVCATERLVCSDEEDKQTSFCFDFVKQLLGLNKYDVIQESRLIFVDKEMEAGNEAKKLSYNPVFNRTHMYTHRTLSYKNQAAGQDPKLFTLPRCTLFT